MPRAEETSLLLTILKQFHHANKTVTYEEIEGKVPGYSRNHLSNALEIAKREEGLIFKCIPTIGYKPISNSGKVSEIERKRLAKIRSQVFKMESELNTVEVLQLSTVEQQQYYSAQLKLSFQKMVADDRLNDRYAIAGQKCQQAGKIEFSPEDFQEALKALA